MTLKTNVKVGTTPIQIGAPNIRALLMTTGFFEQMPKKCGHCGSENIVPLGYTNKGYKFYQLKCRDCNHELKISEAKGEGDRPGNLYIDKSNNWEPPYSESQQGGGGQSQQRQQDPHDGANGGVEDDDDIPF